MVRKEVPCSRLNSRAAWIKRIAASPRFTMATRSNLRITTTIQLVLQIEVLRDGLRKKSVAQSLQRCAIYARGNVSRAIAIQPQVTISFSVHHFCIEGPEIGM